MSIRQPAWFTMLMVALNDNEVQIEHPKERVPEELRKELISAVQDTLSKWHQEHQHPKIPDAALWSIADDEWHTSPVLQHFNNVCQTKGWTPTWHVDAHYVMVGGRTYKLSEETIERVVKKKQKRARLAAMVLIDIDDKQLKAKWLIRNSTG